MRTAIILGLLIAVSGISQADECVPTSSQPEIDLPIGEGGHTYIDNDPCQFDCLFSVWIYQETNGIEGLQRNDPVIDDTCGGQIEPDTFPFL